MSRFRADLLLLINAIIWGTAFIPQKQANDFIGPLTFIGFRYSVSMLLLLPFAFYETRKISKQISRQELFLCVMLGVILFVSMSLQQTGLLTTSATNAGFLTSLYVVLTPFIAMILLKQRPDMRHIIACLGSMIGAWLLATNGTFEKINFGDVQILVSDIGWATWIVLVSIFMSRSDRPFLLALIQYSIATVLGFTFGGVLEETTTNGVTNCLFQIIYAGVFSGGLATTLQAFAQKYTPPADAALIVSLESIFAALAAYIFLGETLTFLAITGCMIILISVISVELKALPFTFPIPFRRHK